MENRYSEISVTGHGARHMRLIRTVMQDRFSVTLLMLVLLTNVAIILSPMLAGMYNISLAENLCFGVTVLQLPGFLVLMYLLSKRFRNKELKTYAAGRMPNPRFKKLHLTIQAFLFASLLCSTFLMHKQLRVLQGHSPESQSETLLQLQSRASEVYQVWAKRITL